MSKSAHHNRGAPIAQPPRYIVSPYQSPTFCLQPFGQSAGGGAGLEEVNLRCFLNTESRPAHHLPWISVICCHDVDMPAINDVELEFCYSAGGQPALTMASHDTNPVQTGFYVAAHLKA